MTNKEILDLYEAEWRKHAALAEGARRALWNSMKDIVRVALQGNNIVPGDVITFFAGRESRNILFLSLERSEHQGYVGIYGRYILKNGKISNVKREICAVSTDDVANGISHLVRYGG